MIVYQNIWIRWNQDETKIHKLAAQRDLVTMLVNIVLFDLLILQRRSLAGG